MCFAAVDEEESENDDQMEKRIRPQSDRINLILVEPNLVTVLESGKRFRECRNPLRVSRNENKIMDFVNLLW